LILNYISDKYYDYLFKKDKIKFLKHTSTWKVWDIEVRYKIYNYGSVSLITLLNCFSHTVLEVFIIITLFNLIRVFARGSDASQLYLCFIISTIYFTILANLSHLIIHSNNNIYLYLCPLLAITGAIFNYYKHIPKLTKEEIIEINNTYEKDPEYVQSIKEMKTTYLKLIGILIVIMAVGFFIFCSKFILIIISFSLISVNIVISDTGEKYYFRLMENIILTLENQIKKLIKR
jgi:Accessory gene regulator B.